MNEHLKRVLTERVNTSLYQSSVATHLNGVLPLKYDDPSLSDRYDHPWHPILWDLKLPDELLVEVEDLCNIMMGDGHPLKSTFANMVADNIHALEKRVTGHTIWCPVVREVWTLLKDEDPESTLVGGAVRDILMDNSPKDYDFASALSYDKLVEIFEENGFTVKERGKQFLVMIVSKEHEDGYSVECEIANYRKDGTYTDGRRPDEVSIGTIEEDAKRSDFTVNALYFNLRRQELIDPTAYGIQHIQEKKLSFVGSAKARIQEDSLRVFRFYRFLSRGFNPDKKSLGACRNHFEVAMKETAPERVRAEIEKIVL